MVLNEVYFWTSTILSWTHLLKEDSYKLIIIGSLKTLAERGLIKVYGFVVMPNHIHLIWELKGLNKKELPDSSFTKFTAHEFKKELLYKHPDLLPVFQVSLIDRNYQFWQRDPLAVYLKDKDILLQKLEYLHLNPLHERWNLVKRPEHYPWSSAKFYDTGIDDFGFLTHFAESV
jgi:putative transposase